MLKKLNDTDMEFNREENILRLLNLRELFHYNTLWCDVAGLVLSVFCLVLCFVFCLCCFVFVLCFVLFVLSVLSVVFCLVERQYL